MTKFERARRYSINVTWKSYLFQAAQGDDGSSEIYHHCCGINYSPYNGCSKCPIGESEICLYIFSTEVPDCMAILLWLMSDDCRSLDDGSV